MSSRGKKGGGGTKSKSGSGSGGHHGSQSHSGSASDSASTYDPKAFHHTTPEFVTLYLSMAFGLAATTISLRLIYKHLRYYTQPQHQRYIIRILLMVPIYSSYSIASIFWPSMRLYFALLRDCYEAYVLYGFFVLCVNYAGGVERLESKMLEQAELQLPFPLNCFRVQPNAKLLLHCRRGLLQYVLIRPIAAIVAIFAEIFHIYHEGNFSFKYIYVYTTILNNISVTIALYCLVLFYLAIFEELKPYKPVLKFLCIKVVVFFCFWQDVTFALLVYIGVVPGWSEWDPSEVASALNNLLVCIEMFVISILQNYAYPYDLYAIKALSQAPLVHDVERASSVVSGLQNTVNPKDVMQDTVDLFVPNQLQNVPSNIREMIRTVSKPASVITGPDSQSPSINQTQSETSNQMFPNEKDDLPMLVAGPSDADQSPTVNRRQDAGRSYLEEVELDDMAAKPPKR
eukprot:TRINITY_DN4505_c0_g1_i1.p1 TRINITY_DN4505_c0_g1~~TRINITY_DN4505_c0_g1_i1.p1  ORF type:complete len:457 (+),score=78.46 TRINITY_DN4505_c0_g1_i1:212-1582(+)